MTVTILDPDNFAPAALERELEQAGRDALQAWGERVDLPFDALTIIVADDVIATAAWSTFANAVTVNTKYLAGVDPDYVLLHEVGHAIYGEDFARHVTLTKAGLFFTGANAVAEYRGPVPVTNDGQRAHVSWGNDSLRDDVMSGVYHTGPAELSDLDIAIAADCGIHVWTSTERAVNAVYHEVLGREADDAGRDYWVGEIDAGHVSQDDFVSVFIAGIVS